MRSLLLILPLLSFEAHAKKFALVVGGAANANMGASVMVPKDVNPHEFGKSTARSAYGLARQGYEVTTLFDTADIPKTRMSEGMKVMQDKSPDIPKLKSMGAKSATKDNILNALRRIRDTAKPGDKFEFNLNAHGFRSCPGDEQGRKGVSTNIDDRKNSKAGCQHMINLSDPDTGATVQVPTAEIAAIIREIDEKGINTNLTLSSCHSGAAQDAFANLKNTCVAYGSSANNYSFMCMPADEKNPADISYTSTLDNVHASQWVAYAEEMKKDPYFKDDFCLKKLAEHSKKYGITGKNRYEIFMKARLHDLNGEEPSLSSQQGIDYFQSGLFSGIGAFYATKKLTELCAEDIDSRVSELQAVADGATQSIVEAQIAPKRARLKQVIARYNDLIKQQIAAGAIADPDGEDFAKTDSTDSSDVPIQAFEEADAGGDDLFAGLEIPKTPVEIKPSSESTGTETKKLTKEEADKKSALLAKLQDETYEVSKEVMALEREIVNDLDQAIVRPQLAENDPCRRS